MKQNDHTESRKMLKLLKENSIESRPPRSYRELSKSPRDKIKTMNVTIEKSDTKDGMNLYSWGLSG